MVFRLASFAFAGCILLAGSATSQSAESVANKAPRCISPPAGARLWSEPASWPSGAVPRSGDCVEIAAGSSVYLDVSPPPLGGLDVQGALIFACRELELSTDWIRVTGRLEIGTSAEPFHHRATITLTDSFDCKPKAERSCFAVEGTGAVSLHGLARHPSWLRLAQTAHAGETSIVLDGAVHWRAGDHVVIASTDFDMFQAEECVITSAAGNVVTLAQPLAHTHWGSIERQAIDGIGVDERAEVGLLSRNVVVQGTPRIDTSGATIAGHVIVRDAIGAGPEAQIEWVEFRELGNEHVLGEYPLHIHRIGDASRVAVRNSSFHHTYNRAVAIHGSQNALLEGNVNFDTIGHAYFIEDDEVVGCALRRNLGLLTRAARPGLEVLASDKAPATFWLHNPVNTIADNAAGGSAAYGFWFEVNDGETAPPTLFTRNVAHSNGDSGFFQDKRPKPASLAVYSNLTAYKNRRYGLWFRSYAESLVTNLRAADNRAGFYCASEGFQNDFSSLRGIARTTLRDSLILGESTNLGWPTRAEELAAGRSLPQVSPNHPAAHVPAWDALLGAELYDGLCAVENTTFADFAALAIPGVIDRRAGALGQVAHASPWAVDPRNYVAGLSFVDANRVYLRTPVGAFGAPKLGGDNGIANTMFLDVDGSLTGVAASVVLPDNAFLVPSLGVTFRAEWNAFITAGPPATPYAQLELSDFSPMYQGTTGATTMSLHALAQNQTFSLIAPVHDSVVYHRLTTNLATDAAYELDYPAALPMSEWSRLFALTFQFTAPGRWVLVSVPLPPPITGAYVEIDHVAVNAAPNLGALGAGPSSGWFFDSVSRRIHMKLVTGGSGAALFDGTRTTIVVIGN